MATGTPWANEFLSRALQEYAIDQQKRLTLWQKQMHIWSGHAGEYETCLVCHPVYTWYQTLWFRVERWWQDHYPRLHFGPCPDDYE